MAGLRKGTKLVANPKNRTIQVRMDEETIRKMDECCEKSGLNRSELIRESIHDKHKSLK